MPRSPCTRRSRAPRDLVVKVGGQRAERRDSRRHRERIARQRSRLIDGPVGATCSIRSRRPPYAATGNPPPITLPSVVRSARDAESLARAAERDAESRHHLVEDEQRAVIVGQLAQSGKKRRIGRDEAARCRRPARR